jgi:type II secretory pathway pseudopilin PulG
MRPTAETRLGFKERRNPILAIGRNTKRCAVITAQRLEGSRFISGQFCRLAASGSRERPKPLRANRSASEPGRWAQMLRWVVSGSRLLLSSRTAKRQSGSPPGVGHAPPSMFVPKPETRRTAALSLIELLVVITIIALVSALITTSVLSALQQQNQRVCLNNMLTIEAAKDEYLRDHPGATSIPSIPDFQPYFRFGIPQCPDNAGTNYQNLLSLTQQVYCPKHPENQQKLSAAPSPAAN